MTKFLDAPALTTAAERLSHPSFARRTLAIGVAIAVVALLIAIAGLVVDPREIAGAPAWMKPAKFALSVAVYLATMHWLMGLLPGGSRLLAVLATVTVFMVTAEMVLLDMQVVRGTTSHFNEATPFDALVYYGMGGLISLVFVVLVVIAVLAARLRGLDRGIAAGIRWGIALCLVGMVQPVLMITNRERNEAGSHTVGALDGGPGMPVTGWSLEYGDLRIGHFVALHAMQVLPLIAWALARFTKLSARTRVWFIGLAGVGYAAIVVVVTMQALAGEPLVRLG